MSTVLCCPVSTGYVFLLAEDIEFDTIFADVIVRNPLEALATKSRIVVDMENMLETVSEEVHYHQHASSSQESTENSGERAVSVHRSAEVEDDNTTKVCI